jgi:hypothetical protein
MTGLAGFNEFWLIFPRAIAKLEALEAYKRALKLTTPDRILTAAKRYADERAGKEVKFTRSAVTWLNGGCWDDCPLPSPSPPPPKLTHGLRTANGVYVKMDTPEWDAWCRHLRAQGKIPPPYSGKTGGWTFPSLNPPQETRIGEHWPWT